MRDRVSLVLYALTLAMGVAAAALSFLGTRSSTIMVLLGVGLFAAGLAGVRSAQK